MRFLAPGNTEFFKSTGLVIPGNFRSRRLKRLLNALVRYQNAHNMGNLLGVMHAVSVWRRYNPKEVMLRGGKLKQLEAQLESSRRLYNQVDRERGALAGMRQEQAFQAGRGPTQAAWATDMQESGDSIAQEIRRAEQRLHAAGTIDAGGADDHIVINDAVLHQKFPVLKKIEITDIPTGVPKEYRFTDTNSFAESDRTQAALILGQAGRHRQYNPKYWLALGKLVTTPRVGRHYGRCLSCASAVIKVLVEDPVYDDLMIEHIGSPNWDHHMVLVGRGNADGTTANGLMEKGNWGEGIILDVWQGNLSPSGFKYVYTQANCKYVSKDLKLFCAFTPDKRAEHRAYLAGVPAVHTQNQAPTFLVQRRRIQMDAAEGRHDAKAWVKVKNPDGTSSWA